MLFPSMNIRAFTGLFVCLEFQYRRFEDFGRVKYYNIHNDFCFYGADLSYQESVFPINKSVFP